MNKYLLLDFKIKHILITLCKQTLLLLGGLYIVLWATSLPFVQFIYKGLVNVPLGYEIGLVVSVATIFFLLISACEIDPHTPRFLSLFSPTLGRGYPLSYRFNWPAIALYVLLMAWLSSTFSHWLLLGYVLLLNAATLCVLLENKKDKKRLTTHEKSNKNDSVEKENQIDIPTARDHNTNEEAPQIRQIISLLKDTPISNLQEDSLGREDFVHTFYHIIDGSYNNRNVILLNGSWGQGKTSVLNCVESYAQEQAQNQLVFRWVNPWQNDTKERFVAALLEEINLFLQYTYPKDRISPSLLKRLSFSVQPFPWININLSSMSTTHNIEVNIRELSDKLKQKQNRLVIMVDDLDRLNKQQILDILASIYLFSECHNIIFVLAANADKVEALLTESQSNETPGEVHSYYTAYQGYLEKIATNIVPLPDILPEFLRNTLFVFLQKMDNYSLLTKEEKEHIPADLFNNLRDVKRVLLEFSNVIQQKGVQGEVNSYHMLLVTLLYVFAYKVYQQIAENPSYWIEEDIKEKIQNLKENNDSLNSYFEGLLFIYPGKRKALQTIFLLLNPQYYNLQYGIKTKYDLSYLYVEDTLKAWAFGKNVLKPFYNRDYFYRYFTHQPNRFTIPDKLMHQHIDKLRILPPGSAAKEVARFLTINEVTRLSSYFSYLRNNLSFEANKTIYSVIADGLCLLLNDDNVNLEIKKLIIEEHIPQWIRQGSVSNEILIHMFNQIHSILFKTYIHYTAEKNNQELYTQLKMPLADNYTANDILKEEEKYLEFRFVHSLIYSWMRDWQSNGIIVYKEERKNQAIHIFKQSEHYFWLAVGKDLYESIDSHFLHILREKTKPWGITTIQQIISSLLKMPHLEHRSELLELQIAIKNLPPEKEAPRHIVK